jgi:hypothetical protein
MGRVLRYSWTAYIVASAGLAGCGGDQLLLGGGGDSGCVPGSYAGGYDCNAGSDASPLAPPNGRIALDLQGDRGGKSLQIAPGAQLTGAQQGGTFSAELTGTVDCTTYKLAGQLNNVRVVSTSPAFTITGQGLGELSADYDASVPALVNGVIISPGMIPLPLVGVPTMCTWSATLQR